MNIQKRENLISETSFSCLICETSGILTEAPIKLINIFEELVRDQVIIISLYAPILSYFMSLLD